MGLRYLAIVLELRCVNISDNYLCSVRKKYPPPQFSLLLTGVITRNIA
jgi:hypothetical protein